MTGTKPDVATTAKAVRLRRASEVVSWSACWVSTISGVSVEALLAGRQGDMSVRGVSATGYWRTTLLQRARKEKKTEKNRKKQKQKKNKKGDEKQTKALNSPGVVGLKKTVYI